MGVSRLLLVAPQGGAAPGYPSADQLADLPSLAAEAAESVQQAVDRLVAAGYDAVVCWAERQDELAALIRLRKARPETPVLLVTPEGDPVFRELARQLGAGAVVPAAREGRRTAELLRTALASGALLTEQAARLRTSHALAQEVRALTQAGRSLVRAARSKVARPPRLSFIPLVIERDAESAAAMGQALRRADIFTPHPVLAGRDEAMAFLETLAQPQSQGRIVAPTAVLVNSGLPGDGAVLIVKAVRARAPLARLPVILLAPGDDPAGAARAYEGGANSIVERPGDPDQLAARLADLKKYWGGLNLGPYPS